MTNPIDILISALAELGYSDAETIFQQGALPKDEPYPDTFFTYWNDNTEDKLFRDNKPDNTEWVFTLSCYSYNPFTLEKEFNKAIQKLKARGFIINGKGADAISDKETHTGRDIKIIYIEKYIHKEEE